MVHIEVSKPSYQNFIKHFVLTFAFLRKFNENQAGRLSNPGRYVSHRMDPYWNERCQQNLRCFGLVLSILSLHGGSNGGNMPIGQPITHN